ncbi:MAG: pilin [bacterium]|nr:pilin [bacterium]
MLKTTIKIISSTIITVFIFGILINTNPVYSAFRPLPTPTTEEDVPPPPTSGGTGGAISGCDPTKGYCLLAPIGNLTQVTTASFPNYLQSIINISLGMTAAIAVIMLVIGGLQYIFSSVSETAKKEAKERITNAVFGVLIALSGYILLRTIGGSDLLKLGLPAIKKLDIPKGAPSIDRGANDDIGGGDLVPPSPINTEAGEAGNARTETLPATPIKTP